jgi:hypothetical protein
MTINHDIEEKIRATAQQAKGKFQKMTGHPIKGEINNQVGKLRNRLADDDIESREEV